MKKLVKRTSTQSKNTIEAYFYPCTCICAACSCWNGILWIGNNDGDGQHHQPNNPQY